ATLDATDLFASSKGHADPPELLSFPTRRSSDLRRMDRLDRRLAVPGDVLRLRLTLAGEDRGGLSSILGLKVRRLAPLGLQNQHRSEEHTSELQSRENLVCRLLLEKKKKSTCRA